MEADRLHALLERLSHVLREDLRGVAARYGLALAQLDAVHYLALANRFSDTVSAMAEYLGATKGTVSQTLSALVRKGLVVRVVDPSDARVQHCHLTAEGQAVARGTRPTPVLRSLGVDSDAADGVERLLRAMIAARGGRAFGVCGTCVHHERGELGSRCRLLGVALVPEDAVRLCREHTARVT